MSLLSLIRSQKLWIHPSYEAREESKLRYDGYGVPLSVGGRTRFHEKFDENCARVARAVTTFLDSQPYITACSVKRTIGKFSEEIWRASNEMFEVLWHGLQGHGHGIISSPIFGRNVGNKYLLNDPTISYVSFIEALEKAVKKTGKIPEELPMPKDRPEGMTAKAVFDENGNCISKFSVGWNVVMFKDYKRMVEAVRRNFA